MNSDTIMEFVREVARTHNAHEEDVDTALKEAIKKALDKPIRDRFGSIEFTIHTTYDNENIKIDLFHNAEVVENEPATDQIALEHAKLIDANAQVGDKVPVKLPFENFDRVSAHIAKSELYKILETLRRNREFTEFKDRIGEVITGVVKQVSYADDVSGGDLIVTVENGIGGLRRRDLIPTEISKYKPGDRIEAYIKAVDEKYYPQIQLSRSHPQFLAKLMMRQVPELATGEIVIKKVVREPGRKAKVAVHSDNPNIDPVSACVGYAGSYIKPVVSELKGLF